MIALVAILDAPGSVLARSDVRRTCERLASRGSLAVASTGHGIVAACSRHESEPAVILDDGELVVAADASLYYRDDLHRALSSEGVSAGGDHPAQLIAAAYRAWGARCAEHLEGDFAFILWDRPRQTIVCARDFGAKRPLYFATANGRLVVASLVSDVLAAPGVSAEIDRTAIAAAAANLPPGATETAWRGVAHLPAGQTLVWTPGAPARCRQNWTLPSAAVRRTPDFDDAAFQLRELLARAVAERIPEDGASIWLSGGWDSTAVFAAANLRPSGASRLQPVSISYPPGDPGREDEIIQAVADRWGATVRWLDIREIPLFDQPMERAGERAEPFAHAFEMWNRALAAASAATGTRVALDGNGGDQLFQVSPVYLADLARSGRWLALHRERLGRGMRSGDVRALFRWSVQPWLGPRLRAAAAMLRGGAPLRHYLERTVPAWITEAAVARHGLAERAGLQLTRRRGESHAGFEMRWFLGDPYFPRVFGCVASFAADAGVELRSPLYDGRIIAFAATRPREERAQGSETKRLLRHAMRGLLPPGVLAPRTHRTGITAAYCIRSLRAGLPPILDELDDCSRLADLGVVEPGRVRAALASFLRSGDGGMGVQLFQTMQVEMWLRGRDTGAVSAPAAGHLATAVSLSLERSPILAAYLAP